MPTSSGALYDRAAAREGGRVLRETRLARGEDLTFAAAFLCMPVGYLEALEDGAWERLPAVPGPEALARIYAEHLGLELVGPPARPSAAAERPPEPRRAGSRRTLHGMPSAAAAGALLAAAVYAGWLTAHLDGSEPERQQEAAGEPARAPAEPASIAGADERRRAGAPPEGPIAAASGAPLSAPDVGAAAGAGASVASTAEPAPAEGPSSAEPPRPAAEAAREGPLDSAGLASTDADRPAERDRPPEADPATAAHPSHPSDPEAARAGSAASGAASSVAASPDAEAVARTELGAGPGPAPPTPETGEAAATDATDEDRPRDAVSAAAGDAGTPPPSGNPREPSPPLATATNVPSPAGLGIPGEPAPAAVLPVPRPTARRATGRFAIHVASVREPADVAEEWGRLLRLHPSLAGLALRPTQRVNLPGKGTFYRVIAGAFPTGHEAAAACQQLSGEGQDCRVVPAR